MLRSEGGELGRSSREWSGGSGPVGRGAAGPLASAGQHEDDDDDDDDDDDCHLPGSM